MNELAPGVEFHEDIRLFLYRPEGTLDEANVNRLISILGDLERTEKEPFNRFGDTVGADEIELNFKYIVHVSLFRRLSYAGRPPIKSALLATDSAMLHYAKLHKLMTEGSPIHVKVFKDRGEAAAWLGLPIERLMPAAGK